MDIHKQHRVRNIFQFHSEAKEYRLIFDDCLCVTFLHKKEKSKLIHLYGGLSSLPLLIREENAQYWLIF
mgnify:CR=1 FL=1